MHVLNFVWSQEDNKNWVSQLALPTQYSPVGVHYRTSSGACGKTIDNYPWIRLLDATNYCAISSSQPTAPTTWYNTGTRV
jgi:hypothetical protein